MDAPTSPPLAEALAPAVGPLAEEHIERAFRIMIAGADADPRFLRFITGEPHPFGNFALISRDAPLRSVTEAVEPLRRCASPSAALFIGPAQSKVTEALAGWGFEPHGDMPAMAVDIDALAPVSRPDGCSFERIAPGPQADEWAEAFAEGYELPRRVAALFAPIGLGNTADPGAPFQYFAARRNGRIVATSLLYLNGGVAGIYGVSTVPRERGKGLGALMTAEPLGFAHSLGYRVGVLQASPAGHPVYLRLGFRVVGTVPLFVRPSV